MPPAQMRNQPQFCSDRRATSRMAAAAGIRSSLRARLVGTGSCAPETRVTNADLEAIVETNDEWITKRTGIQSRHLLKPDENLCDLSATAARRALESAGIAAEDVDLVIVATSSPDDLFGDGPYVASAIGATNAVAFDLTAACSGFLFGVNTAAQFLHTGAYKTAVVVGADALSRWVDWDDRNTCVLFGDGAGAAVLIAAESDSEAGLLGFEMHSNGAGRPELNCAYAGSARKLASITQAVYHPARHRVPPHAPVSWLRLSCTSQLPPVVHRLSYPHILGYVVGYERGLRRSRDERQGGLQICNGAGSGGTG
jgi:3-oxoacyl-[acyl-carrier-protein] synthase III